MLTYGKKEHRNEDWYKASKFCVYLSNNIQQAHETGNIRAMCAGIKIATGKLLKKTVSLLSKFGEMIMNCDKQMERWVEHHLELYLNKTCVSAEVIASIKTLPQMDKLGAQPILVELSKAIDALSNCKAPGEDGIPSEIIKWGKKVMLSPLNNLLLLCWNIR